MLNNPTISKVAIGAPNNQILVNSMPFKAVGVRIAAANSNGTDGLGRKIMRAGTPIEFDPTDRQTVATPVTDDTVMPRGVLVHDVPLWNGDANGQAITDGGIVLEHVHEDIQTIIKATQLVTPESNILVITKD